MNPTLSAFQPIDTAPNTVEKLDPPVSPADSEEEETHGPRPTKEKFMQKIDSIVNSFSTADLPLQLKCTFMMGMAGCVLMDQSRKVFTKAFVEAATKNVLCVPGVPDDPCDVIKRLGRPIDGYPLPTVSFEDKRVSYMAFMPDEIARSSREAQVEWAKAFYAQMYTALVAHLMPMPDAPCNFDVTTIEETAKLVDIMASLLSQCTRVIQDMEQETGDRPYSSPRSGVTRALAFPPAISPKYRGFHGSSARYNTCADYQMVTTRIVSVDKDRIRAGAGGFASLALRDGGLSVVGDSRIHYYRATCLDFFKDADPSGTGA